MFIVSEILRLVRTKGYRYRDMAVIVSDMETYAEYMERAFRICGVPFFMDHKRSVLLLVRTKGYRYRDMAVIVSDMETYAEYMERAFRICGVPFFMDHKRSVLLNSFVEYLRSLLAMIDENFSYESTFRFLRTNLTGFTQEEVDDVENYVVNSFVEYLRSLLAMIDENFSYESTFRFLRTNLTGFTQEEVDDVENYVVALGIRGYKKWKEMIDENFSYESTFRFLRTNLTGFTQEEVDDVENYVVALGIRGYKKWKEIWVRQSPHADAEDMLRWNAFRQKFIEKLERITEVLKRRKKTVREVTEAIYAFLVQEEMQKKIGIYEVQFQERGQLVLAKEYAQIYRIVLELFDKFTELLGAKEYAQIYRIVLELFDKFTELLGEEQISLGEYRELLDAGLQEAKVGVIPPGIDQVVVGDIERTRLQDVKVLFLAGVNDTWLPGKQGAGGLLSEYDRERFQEQKVALAPGAKEQAYIQKFYLYLSMTGRDFRSRRWHWHRGRRSRLTFRNFICICI